VGVRAWPAQDIVCGAEPCTFIAEGLHQTGRTLAIPDKGTVSELHSIAQ